MPFEPVQFYLLAGGAAAFLLFRYFRLAAVKKRLPGLSARGAQFVDVRTPGEFAAGNRPGSLNIPLDELAARARELDKARPVVLSCASGARSAAAVGLLKGLGFSDVTNAGPWQNTL